MKCEKCGFENKDEAKFCTKCGSSLNEAVEVNTSQNSNSMKYIIIALIIIILLLVGILAYSSLATNSGDNQVEEKNVTSQVDSSQESDGESASTKTVSSQSSPSKSWESIGSYSGSGSGSKVIEVPAGEIRVDLSAYPIKNYATNHLYVSGSNGQSGGVDWGSTSAVETRSDSFTYTSSSPQTFNIDYYETVSWEVTFYRYQ
ncbi:zinc ribbon domain-containing protein [Methanobrevibacter sp.]